MAAFNMFSVLLGVILMMVSLSRSTVTAKETVSSLTAQLKTAVESLNNETKSAIQNKSLTNTRYINAITELCHFYDTIEEYETVTANSTDAKADAVKAVMNEVYSDSCTWLKTLENFTSNFDCTNMTSPDVVELCGIMTLESLMEPMLGEINQVATALMQERS